MDKLFIEWVGEKNKDLLYEILAYSCLTDYPIHTLFSLIGVGRNGKSRFLALVNNFIGCENISSTELDQLTESRFESAKLFKKLVCVLGETNFGLLEKTSIIKKLTGQDLIGAEFKGKNPFDFINYAKLLIASNSLPSSTDTSEGFYRRWLIIDFPNEFSEGKDILEIIPKEEYNNLANKVIEILPKLIDKGIFTNQGTIEDRKKRYIMASNPLSLFINSYCVTNIDAYIKYNELYLAYLHYLQVEKRRRISRKEFNKVLEDEGFQSEKTSRDNENGYFVLGIKLCDNFLEKVTKVTKVLQSQLSIYTRELSENYVTNVTNVTNPPNFEQKNTIFINKPSQEIAARVVSWLENIEQPTQAIIMALQNEGLSEKEAELFINKSIIEGLLFEPKSGYLRCL
jgi:P4 family phage/plasmid primase-like protien